MSQPLHSTEGVVLRVIPFRDYDQIVSIFTPTAGLVKVLRKGGRAKSKGASGSCMPLTKVELVYREKRGEIFGCHQLNYINMFSELRKDLCSLEVGCDLLQVILDSQFIGKEAPLLYALLCSYLTKIPFTHNPWVLAASFRLKLLKHDGLIRFPFFCSECGMFLEREGYSFGSGSWCTIHRPVGSFRWELVDLQAVYRLAESQNYSEICMVDVSVVLRDKIFEFFKGCLDVD